MAFGRAGHFCSGSRIETTERCTHSEIARQRERERKRRSLSIERQQAGIKNKATFSWLPTGIEVEASKGGREGSEMDFNTSSEKQRAMRGREIEKRHDNRTSKWNATDVRWCSNNNNNNSNVRSSMRIFLELDRYTYLLDVFFSPLVDVWYFVQSRTRRDVL